MDLTVFLIANKMSFFVFILKYKFFSLIEAVFLALKFRLSTFNQVNQLFKMVYVDLFLFIIVDGR